MIDIRLAREHPDEFRRALARKGAAAEFDELLQVDAALARALRPRSTSCVRGPGRGASPQRRSGLLSSRWARSCEKPKASSKSSSGAGTSSSRPCRTRRTTQPRRVQRRGRPGAAQGRDAARVLLRAPRPLGAERPRGPTAKDPAQPGFDLERRGEGLRRPFCLPQGRGRALGAGPLPLRPRPAGRASASSRCCRRCWCASRRCTARASCPPTRSTSTSSRATASTSPAPPRSRWRRSTRTRSWPPRRSRFATRATRPAFAARRGRPGATPGASSGCTSSTRSRCSSSPIPRRSREHHEEILAIEEDIVRGLGIAYRVVVTAAGDLGPSAAKKYDVEAWIPSQGRYREITSCSNTTDYQARRLNVRFRDADGSLRFVHTLNGTAMTARFLIALLEANQDDEGHVDGARGAARLRRPAAPLRPGVAASPARDLK